CATRRGAVAGGRRLVAGPRGGRRSPGRGRRGGGDGHPDRGALGVPPAGRRGCGRGAEPEGRPPASPVGADEHVVEARTGMVPTPEPREPLREALARLPRYRPMIEAAL